MSRFLLSKPRLPLFFGKWKQVSICPVRYASSEVSDERDYKPEHLYPERGTFVQSSTEENPVTGRPIPLNVELASYAPFKHPCKYGDKVAEITLASFATKDLDFYADFLLRAAFYLKIPARGPTPLPRKIKRWTVIRSPFVLAKYKENFERITYRRLIKLYDANPETVQVLLSVANKYPIGGVGVKANYYTQENLEMVENMDVPTESDRENPLSLNKIDPRANGGAVANVILELLKEPRFGLTPSKFKEISEAPIEGKKGVGESAEKANETVQSVNSESKLAADAETDKALKRGRGRGNKTAK